MRKPSSCANRDKTSVENVLKILCNPNSENWILRYFSLEAMISRKTSSRGFNTRFF